MESQIAQLRERLELESRAMFLALNGFAQTAKHEIIDHKYANLLSLEGELAEHLGPEQAHNEMVDAYIRASNEA